MNNDTRRRQARELTLQVLFQEEYIKNLDTKKSLDYFKGEFEAHSEVIEFAEMLITGIAKHLKEIDSIVQDYSQNWKIKRMASVDLIILRIAIFELVYLKNEVPYAATINEALEIAKKYSTNDSSPFINGILDQVHKEKGSGL
ncbi:MAG: transcription antitermination factor NusB [Bdellovibrionaceae bacterium]|jgi:transcription antitermination protein NusB|nr:transcription antitermination factor NusB [Pseudobdellovibrionaceae bacterium]